MIVPDLQIPLHDRKLISRFTVFLEQFNPSELAFVGDITDSTEVARWSKDKPDEFTGNLQHGFDLTHRVLRGFREACPDATMRISRSNHDERSAAYIERYAPALRHLRELTLPRLLKLDELNITYHEKPIEVAPGWIVMHGDEGRLAQVPGQTALKLAISAGKSVACGHTHRAGLMHATESYGGRVRRTLWGLEVGHFMDLNKATYLKSGGANWKQAFGLLSVDGSAVMPSLIPVREDGSFMVEGVVYR